MTSNPAHSSGRPCPFTKAEFEHRLEALKHSRDVIWKKNPGYCRILDVEIFALELAVEYVSTASNEDKPPCTTSSHLPSPP